MNDDSELVMQAVFDELKPIYEATEQSLNEWQGEGNLQFPILLGMIAVRMNWDEKQLRENDPFVRKYVRKHSKWHVTRGAFGGIMRTEDKQKKEADKNAKELAKKQMKDAIVAKAAALAAAKKDTPEE